MTKQKNLIFMLTICPQSEMATVVFNKVGRILFSICLCLYLFGDMTIYAAAVGKSLVDATWLVFKFNTIYHNLFSQIYFNNFFFSILNSTNATDMDNCWEHIALSRRNVYQIYLVIAFHLFFNVLQARNVL